MRWDWLGRLDWRWLAGVLSVVAVGAGSSGTGVSAGDLGASLWVAAVIASAALLAVLLGMSRRGGTWSDMSVSPGFSGQCSSGLSSGAGIRATCGGVDDRGRVVGGVIAIILLIRRSRLSRMPARPAPAGVRDGPGHPRARRELPVHPGREGHRRPGRSAPFRPITAEVFPVPADTELVQTESFDVGGERQHVFVIAVPTEPSGRPGGADRGALPQTGLAAGSSADRPPQGVLRVPPGARPHHLERALPRGHHRPGQRRPAGLSDRPGTVNLYIR